MVPRFLSSTGAGSALVQVLRGNPLVSYSGICPYMESQRRKWSLSSGVDSLGGMLERQMHNSL